jgi:6-phosphogluconolactonase
LLKFDLSIFNNKKVSVMKSKIIALLSVFLLLSSMVFAQKYYVLIGGREGIFTYGFDSKTGELVAKSTVTPGTSFLAIAPDRKHVYSATAGNTATSFNYNSKTGELTLLNSQPIGAGSAYVSVDAKHQYLFSASYGGGSLSAVPIEKDGSLGAELQLIQHVGKSIAMAKPYVHSIVVTPDNRYVITSDLGTDSLSIYNFDPSKRPNPLTLKKSVALAPGAGPRHSTFAPNGKFYYSVTELNSTVNAFRYQNGEITPIQTLSMIPAGYTGKGDGADIHVSPDGKFLYANTRNELNDVLIYSINQNDGKLTLVGRQPTFGKSARTFDIDPTGNFLIITNSATNDVYVFKRDQKTGLLTPTGQKLDIKSPGIIRFVQID